MFQWIKKTCLHVGLKHKIMAERSKVTKGKKKDRERMRNVRETAKKVVADLGCFLEPSSPSIHTLREVKLSLVLNPLFLLLGALAIVRLSLLLLCLVCSAMAYISVCLSSSCRYTLLPEPAPCQSCHMSSLGCSAATGLMFTLPMGK